MQKYLFKTCFITIFMSVLLFTGCSKKNNEIVLDMQEDIGSQSDAISKEGAFLEQSSKNESATDIASDQDSAYEDKKESGQAQSDVADTQTKAQDDQAMVIYVCGAVECEGVYELGSGSRVVDAVKAAGGFSSDADTSYLNQAQILEDGVKIRIPTREEVAALEGDAKGSAEDNFIENSSTDKTADNNSSSNDAAGTKVNINTATEDELTSIPGIGPSKASSIISYREENGKFSSIEDIMNVTGIKDKFFARIKDYITV